MKLVMKFGGTSLNDGKRIRHIAELVKNHSHSNEIVLVASAMEGVTERLIELTENAREGAIDAVEKSVSSLKERHRLALDDAVKDRKSTRLNSSHSAKSRMPSSA